MLAVPAIVSVSSYDDRSCFEGDTNLHLALSADGLLYLVNTDVAATVITDCLHWRSGLQSSPEGVGV